MYALTSDYFEKQFDRTRRVFDLRCLGVLYLVGANACGLYRRVWIILALHHPCTADLYHRAARAPPRTTEMEAAEQPEAYHEAQAQM